MTYDGPDTDHVGSEICFNSNEDHVAIVDVTDKSSPQTLSTFVYANLGFVHQNWLSEDQHYLFIGDEFDELNAGVPTSTVVADVGDLDAPVVAFIHEAGTASVDHNMYVRGNLLYQANYSSGLRVLEFGDLSTDTLNEVAFFDTRPQDDAPNLGGAWSVYPYFASGVLVVSDTLGGLFVVSLE